ncbi:Hypothetical protein HDN1F_32630 [gamma proteobacterium HdN1]|nr:Hypothetical protein HDN1F_32630 [gamma proteobacterium HdN1]
MVRRWWKALYLMQALLFGAFGTFFYLLSSDLTVVALLLWWLKAVFETFHLQFLGRALFNEELSAWEILRHRRAILFHDLFAKLTWRRLNPFRNFLLPITELEELEGRAYQQRVKTLTRASRDHVFWVSAFGILAELLLTLNLLLIAYEFLPREITDRVDWNQLLFDETLANATAIALILSMMLVMPYYVATGFCVYINRRTWLEGWDIELTFRQLVLRLTNHSANASTAAGNPSQKTLSGVVALLFLISGLFHSPAANAEIESAATQMQMQMSPAPPASPRALQKTRDQIGEILEGPDYHRLEERRMLRPLIPNDGASGEAGVPPVFSWLTNFANWVARIAEILLWIGVAALLWVLIQLWPRFQHSWSTRTAARKAPPSVVIQSHEESPYAFPVEITEAAKQYWHTGQHRAALSLLYRGALAQLAAQLQLPLEGSHTEAESMEICRQHCPAEVNRYFQHLTDAWVRIAYGHQSVKQEEFELLTNDWAAFHAHASAAQR